MSQLVTHTLYSGQLAVVRDVHCHAQRSPCGGEEQAVGNVLIFTRRGVFARHSMHRGRPAVIADSASAILLNVGESYRVSHPADGGDESTVLAFPTRVAREVSETLDGADSLGHGKGPLPFRRTHALVRPAVALRLQRLRLRLRQAHADSLSTEEEALGILSTVLRDASGVDRAAPARPRRVGTRRARRELANAVKEILANVAGGPSPSLQELGRTLSVSPFHLTRAFHAEVGLPVHQYLLRLRLCLALQRIVDTPAGLSTIALDAGFASHAHFTDAFRRLFGVTPSNVRRGSVRAVSGLRRVAARASGMAHPHT